MLTLHLPQADPVGVDARGLVPGAFDCLDGLKRHRLWCGNREVEAGELLTISGEASSTDWRLTGDWSRVHYLGSQMQRGAIRVESAVGRYCGAWMGGGRIEVGGRAGDFLGAELRGGALQVFGDAGDYVGGSLEGSKCGMRGGTIAIAGRAGAELGRQMRRGVLVVGGACGPFAGYRMRAGTMVLMGRSGEGAGLDMLRGTIGLFGSAAAPPATFRRACVANLPVLSLLRREVRRLADDAWAARVPDRATLYNGDLLRGGRGEILVAAPAAPS